MLATLALAALLQVPATVPKDAEIIYPVMPRLRAVANPDGSAVALRQSIHAITATLGKGEVGYETLSLYKNTAPVEGVVELAVVFESYRHGFGPAIKVEALWSDQPVEPVKSSVAPGQLDGSTLGTYTLTYRLTAKKSATHSLRLKFKLPLAKSGAGRKERLVGYKVVDTGQESPLSQFRMSVKYTPQLVYAPIAAMPDWGWEVGANGAYLKLDGRPSDRDSVLTFRYYPPTL